MGNVDDAVCYPACSEAADCNAIWGYANSTCEAGVCNPGSLLLSTCSEDADCDEGFSCFDASGLTDYGVENFCYPPCSDQSDCDAISYGECVTVDYVVFEADICTASPSNYACDTDDDCEGDLKCFGSGPASLCYVGCDSDDDCVTGGGVDYECIPEDLWGFSACRPVDTWSSTCTDDDGCAGSVCVTMDNGAGGKLSFCDDSAVSTMAGADNGSAAAPMRSVMLATVVAAASMALITQ